MTRPDAHPREGMRTGNSLLSGYFRYRRDLEEEFTLFCDKHLSGSRMVDKGFNVSPSIEDMSKDINAAHKIVRHRQLRQLGGSIAVSNT